MEAYKNSSMIFFSNFIFAYYKRMFYIFSVKLYNNFIEMSIKSTWLLKKYDIFGHCSDSRMNTWTTCEIEIIKKWFILPSIRKLSISLVIWNISTLCLANVFIISWGLYLAPFYCDRSSRISVCSTYFQSLQVKSFENYSRSKWPLFLTRGFVKIE